MCAEGGDHSLPTMLHPWWIFGVRVQTMCDGGRTLVPGADVAAYKIPGVRGGAGGRITYATSPGSARRGVGGSRTPPPPPPLGEAKTYQVSFPAALARLRFPVEGYQEVMTSHTNLRVHFAHRHMRGKFVILEEGNWPYPLCTK